MWDVTTHSKNRGCDYNVFYVGIGRKEQKQKEKGLTDSYNENSVHFSVTLKF